jgi:hypothetical protein
MRRQKETAEVKSGKIAGRVKGKEWDFSGQAAIPDRRAC